MVTVMLAIKFHEDEYFKNEYYAKVAGISLEEMNALECELLELLDFKLLVPIDTFTLYLEKFVLFSAEL
jgi:hypothetical protein